MIGLRSIAGESVFYKFSNLVITWHVWLVVNCCLRPAYVCTDTYPLIKPPPSDPNPCPHSASPLPRSHLLRTEITHVSLIQHTPILSTMPNWRRTLPPSPRHAPHPLHPKIHLGATAIHRIHNDGDLTGDGECRVDPSKRRVCSQVR